MVFVILSLLANSESEEMKTEKWMREWKGKREFGGSRWEVKGKGEGGGEAVGVGRP